MATLNAAFGAVVVVADSQSSSVIKEGGGAKGVCDFVKASKTVYFVYRARRWARPSGIRQPVRGSSKIGGQTRRVENVNDHGTLTRSTRPYAHPFVGEHRHQFVFLQFLIHRIVTASFHQERQIQAHVVRERHVLRERRTARFSKRFRKRTIPYAFTYLCVTGRPFSQKAQRRQPVDGVAGDVAQVLGTVQLRSRVTVYPRVHEERPAGLVHPTDNGVRLTLYARGEWAFRKTYGTRTGKTRAYGIGRGGGRANPKMFQNGHVGPTKHGTSVQCSIVYAE